MNSKDNIRIAIKKQKASVDAEEKKDAEVLVFNKVHSLDEWNNMVNELKELIKVSKNIVFHGQIPRDEVFELMKKCFCFTMVSEKETFGMVYIEAMLAGCVTVASKDGGVD